MAVDDRYATPNELRSYLAIKDSIDDNLLELAVQTASRWIDEECSRKFWLDDTTSTKVYFPVKGDLWTDDFDPATTITVELDQDEDGTFETTLTTSDYLALPVNPLPGRPQTRLRRIRSTWWPSCNGLPTVRVTAAWGWPSVPEPVKQACLIWAADMFKMKDAPFGVAGFGDLGAVRVRANAAVDQLLAPYYLTPLVG